MLGSKVLEEKFSPINGRIQVLKTLGLGTYIQVNDLTQSGGVVESIWKSTLKKVLGIKPSVGNCLILGLGGGSAAKWVRRNWPQAEIVGVDIDSIMVELGKKYLELEKYKIEIIIADAYKFLNHKFDLILVDIYQGDKIPDKFETEKFIQAVYSHLKTEGIAIFNRLYYQDKRSLAIKFARKLEKVFMNVDYFYPEANIMFVCFS
jgi:spermidine synthase